jgi:CRP/FNR family transcriptional regulator, anaerobic regulatory protein
MIDAKIRLMIEQTFPSLEEVFNSSLKEEFFANSILISGDGGGQLFQEHDPVALFPLVLEGSIRVYKEDASGKSVGLYEVSPGEGCILSTSSLLSNKKYPASGKIELPLQAIGIPKELFFKMMDQSPRFRMYVFSIFSDRMAHLLETIEAVAFQKLDYRLLKYLNDRGSEIKTTHQKVADDLGSSREIVSRLLKRFEREGIVTLEREKILIDKAKLSKSLSLFV